MSGRATQSFVELAWRLALFGGLFTTAAQVTIAFFRPELLMFQISSVKPYDGEPLVADSHGALTRLAPIVLCVWLLVGVVRVARLFIARRRLSTVLRDAVCLYAHPIVERASALEPGLTLTVSFSPTIRVPMVMGTRICLPSRALTEMPSDELSAVVAHEVAHVVRRDAVWSFCAMIVERALWIQPLNVLAASRLRALAECACDDWAVSRTGDRLALAAALSRAAGWLVASPLNSIALAMASVESLALARVRRLVADAANVPPVKRSYGLMVAFGVLSGTSMVAPGISDISSRNQTAPKVAYTISAYDEGGPFTLTVNRGTVVEVTMDGLPIHRAEYSQTGNRLHVLSRRHGTSLDLTLTTSGGIRWTSRPRP